MSRHLRKHLRISKRRNLVTVDDVVELVKKAHDFGYSGCGVGDSLESSRKFTLNKLSEWLNS